VRGLTAVVVGAFVVRVVYAVAFAPDVTPFGDDSFYHLAALQLADGLGYKEGILVLRPTAAHPPLYPLGLAGIASLGGRSVDAQRMLGVCAGTATVLVVGLIAMRLAGRRAGLAAALLCGAYPAFIAADGALMSETLFALLVACAILQALRELESSSPAGIALLGALIGAAALTRSEGLLLVPAGLALALLAAPRRQRAQRATAVLVAAAILIGPWVARNHHVFGRVLYTTNEGTTLAGANCDPTYYGDQIGGFTTECLPRPPPDANAAEVTSERRHAALRYVDAHRGRAAVVAGARVLRMWGFYAIDVQTRVDGRDRGLQTAGAVAFYPLLALGAAGAGVLFARGRRAPLAVMLTPLALSTVTAALTYGLPRLRHISDVSLLALAGVAVTAGARARSSATTPARRLAGSPAEPPA
jgi:hypothetical protein